MFDLLIKNGFMIDGTGRAGVRADVGIVSDRIVEVGEIDASACCVIDAEGCVVSPGFIDIHSHTDEMVLANPTCESKVTQGVTTEVSGNCGESAAPRCGHQNLQEYAASMAKYGINPVWSSLGEFLSYLSDWTDQSDRNHAISINFATLVGHGNVRSAAMGYDDRPPSDQELDEMRRLVDQAMLDGAFGLSSGLVYPPGCYAQTDELIELCKVAARYGGIYATHVRNEAEGVVSAVEEAIRIGREAGVGVQISHHKSCGRNQCGIVKETLAMIDEARAEGIDVWADQYPYVATCTSLSSILPKWAHDGGKDALLRRLSDPSERARLREELLGDQRLIDCGGWASIVVNDVRHKESRFCEGLNIAEIATRFGKSPVDTVLDLLLEEQAGVGIIHFCINEDDVAVVMRHPAVVIGTDATARCRKGPLSECKPHPRAYGTFPRVLGKYVREGVLTLEQAVAKMTGMPAKRLSLTGRGILTEGNFADIVVFDPEKIVDTATFQEPHSLASGINYVLVNGKPAVEHGEIAEPGSGRVLRRINRR